MTLLLWHNTWKNTELDWYSWPLEIADERVKPTGRRTNWTQQRKNLGGALRWCSGVYMVLSSYIALCWPVVLIASSFALRCVERSWSSAPILSCVVLFSSVHTLFYVVFQGQRTTRKPPRRSGGNLVVASAGTTVEGFRSSIISAPTPPATVPSVNLPGGGEKSCGISSDGTCIYLFVLTYLFTYLCLPMGLPISVYLFVYLLVFIHFLLVCVYLFVVYRLRANL